ncbi:unnamed protein product, partial [Musa textilis]
RIRVFPNDKDTRWLIRNRRERNQPWRRQWRDSASDRLRFFFAEERMDAPSPQPSGASHPPVTMTPTRPRNGRR